MARTLALLPVLALVACPTTTIPPTDTNNTDDTGTTPPPVSDCEPGETVVLEGTILGERTLDAHCLYALRGEVAVGEPYADALTDLTVVQRGTLQIPAGTQIRAEGGTDAMLVVNRGSRIVALGTADDPIVMSSDATVGQRGPGDWAGLVLNGRARLNSGTQATGDGGLYGGIDDNDGSGILNYVRIEFAGALNSGLALNGVGISTAIDHVQVHNSLLDGVALAGGTVDIKHVLVTGPEDDGLTWTDGWTGFGQWIVIQQHAGGGDNGLEGGNNTSNNAASPRSAPILSNVTVIGQHGNDGDIGVLFESGTAGRLANYIISGFEEENLGTAGGTDPRRGGCMDIDDVATFVEAQSGGLTVAFGRLDCETTFDMNDAETDPFRLDQWALVVQQSNVEANLSVWEPGFQDQVNPDFATTINDGSSPGQFFFDETNVIGGVGAGPGQDWTVDWAFYPVN